MIIKQLGSTSSLVLLYTCDIQSPYFGVVSLEFTKLLTQCFSYITVYSLVPCTLLELL